MTFLRILWRLKHQHVIFNFVLHYSSIGSSCGTTVIFQLYCPGMQRNPNLLAGTGISVFFLKVFSKKIYSTVRTVSLLNFVFVFFAYKPIKEEDNRCDMMRYKVEPVSPKSPHSRPVFAAEDLVSARLPLNTNATVQISVVPFNEKTNEFPLMEPSMLVIPPKSQCKFFLNDDMLKFKVFICLFSWRDAFSSIIHF